MSRTGNQGAALDRAERQHREAKAARDAIGKRPYSRENERQLQAAERALRSAQAELDRAQRNYGR